jgi:hypothetical protein
VMASLPGAADRQQGRGLADTEFRRQAEVMSLRHAGAYPNCAGITKSGTPRIERRLA